MFRAYHNSRKLARLAAPDAMQTLIDIAGDTDEEGRVRVVASLALLDAHCLSAGFASSRGGGDARPPMLRQTRHFGDPSHQCCVVELIEHSAEPLFTGHLRLRRPDQKARSRRPDITCALKGEISRFV